MEDWKFLATLCSVLVILTTVVYSYQFFYLFLPMLLKKKKHQEPKRNRYAILIAARNEEPVLPYLLESIKAQDYPAELIDTYVIADNCTDRTAEVAREGGATVFTRFNKKLIGKGYALNYLLEQMRGAGCLEQYDAFLIFDADNLLEPDYITKMNQLPSDGYRAFCGYRNSKNFGTNWITAGYALWYLHESSHMNRSRYLIGSSCSVNGTGFGFTRDLLEQMGGWNFFTLTEDIEFNTWCASHGVKIGYCQEAMLYDEQPITFHQSYKQRIRWAQGGLQVSTRYIGSLLKGIFTGRWISYACTELLSMSLWGFGFATMTGVLTMVLTFSHQPFMPCLLSLALAGVLAYLSLTAVGVWTVITEWKNIRASVWQRAWSVFCFPLFVLTFAPITVIAMFTKFQWEPISHTVAISGKELSAKYR